MFPAWPIPAEEVVEIRSLRRRARAAYTTDCETEYFLVPNKLLELNPPDKFIPFICDLHSLLAVNKHRTVGGFLNVGKKFFEKYFRPNEYATALAWLEKNGIIIRPESYSTGTETIEAFAKAIKITDEAHFSGYSTIKLRAKKNGKSKLRERPDNFVQRYVDMRPLIDMAPGALSENERIFNEKLAAACRIENMVKRNEAVVIAHSNRANFARSINQLRSGKWWATRDSMGRVHYPYEFLPSRIRAYLTIGGEFTVELDASNLHPANLVRILKSIAAMRVEEIMELLAKWDRTPNKKNTRARKIVPDEEYAGDRSEVAASVYEFELRERAVTLKRATQEGMDELNEFERLTSASTLYEALRKKVGHPNLKEVKTIVLACLNEKASANWGTDLEKRVRIAFQGMFPFTDKCMRQMKKETHGLMSVALTLKESEIFEHPVVNALCPARVHDAVQVKESLADKAMDALKYSLGAARVNTTIKVTRPERRFTQDVPPASEWRYEDGWVRGNQETASISYEEFLSAKQSKSPGPCLRPVRDWQRYLPTGLPLPLCAAKLNKINKYSSSQFRTNRPFRVSVNWNTIELATTKARPPP